MTRPKAYSYIRMSTPDQLRGDSLRRQLAKTQRYADKHELEIVERFDDLGVSAFRGRNVEFGALARFRDLLDGGEVPRGSYLIVESMDRLSRDKAMKAFSQLAEIINRGIIVVTLDDEQTYSEDTLERHPYGLMIALGAMARAHEESKRKAGLLADVWGEKKRQARDDGKIISRRMPAWLTIDPETNKIVVVPHRGAVIEEIFTLVRDGWGAYSIARRFNQRGLLPWSTRANSVWRESYIKKILASRTVLGEYQPHRLVHTPGSGTTRVPDGLPISAYYPAVVSPQLFADAQLAISRRSGGGRGRKGPQYTNLFTGMLRCACGGGYRYIDKGPRPKGGQYLQCSVSFSKGPCSAKPIRYALFELVVLQAIETLDISRVLGGEPRQKRLADKRYELSMAQIEKRGLAEKIQHVLTVITSDSGIAPASLRMKLTELERDLSAKNKEIEGLERQLDEIASSDPDSHKLVVQKLLAEIRETADLSTMEASRRALVAELQRVLDVIHVHPITHVSWEIIKDDPDWKQTYQVVSEAALEKLVRALGFELRIIYRNGDMHAVSALNGVYLKLKGSRRMRDLEMLARVTPLSHSGESSRSEP